MRGDLLGNALMDFTHLFDKMLFFLWAFYPIMTIVSDVNIQLWFDIVWYYVILVMCLWISPQFLERLSVNEYERMFANIQASCSIIFSLQNNNNKFEKGHKLLCKKNEFIYISAVKWLIASKIKVFVYITYECLLCLFIMYI